MTRHYPGLDSASDWLKREGISFEPIRNTTKTWIVTRHQYGISTLVTQTSFFEGSSGDLAKRRLFSQANIYEREGNGKHNILWRHPYRSEFLSEDCSNCSIQYLIFLFAELGRRFLRRYWF